jgi:hypothetical protein
VTRRLNEAVGITQQSAGLSVRAQSAGQWQLKALHHACRNGARRAIAAGRRARHYMADVVPANVLPL